MLRALRFVLNINYRQLSINYFVNFFSLIISLMFIHVKLSNCSLPTQIVIDPIFYYTKLV